MIKDKRKVPNVFRIFHRVAVASIYDEIFRENRVLIFYLFTFVSNIKFIDVRSDTLWQMDHW